MKYPLPMMGPMPMANPYPWQPPCPRGAHGTIQIVYCTYNSLCRRSIQPSTLVSSTGAPRPAAMQDLHVSRGEHRVRAVRPPGDLRQLRHRLQELPGLQVEDTAGCKDVHVVNMRRICATLQILSLRKLHCEFLLCKVDQIRQAILY